MFLFSPVEFAARPEAVWLPENRYEHIHVRLFRAIHGPLHFLEARRLPTSLRIIRIRLPRLVDVFA
jgi:hypothetical protein